MGKLKKLLFLFIFLLMFLGVTNVYASDKNISVEKIEVLDKSSTITVDNLIMENNNISSNIIFNKVDDYVTLKLTIKNSEKNSYKIESIKDNNSNENLEIEYNYDENYIESNKESYLIIKLSYAKKLINVDSIDLDNLVISLNFINEKGESSEVIINNPTTGDNIVMYVLLFILVVLGLIFINKTVKVKNVKVGAFILVLAVVVFPFAVFAVDEYKLNIKFTKVKIVGEFEKYSIRFNLDKGTIPVGDIVNDGKVITDENGNKIIEMTVTYGDKLELPGVPEKLGYEFTGWINEDNKKVDNNIVVKGPIEVTAKYKIIQYKITYDLNGGKADNPKEYTVEDEIVLNNPTKKGYTFSGWTGSNNEVEQTRVTINKGTTGDLEFKANYSTNQDTAYKVIHRYQKLDGTYEEEVENLTGATDTKVEPALRVREGYENPELQELIISGEGTSEVVYVYNRIKYNFRITDRTYVDETTTANGTYPYGTEITLKAIARVGYDFSWSDENTNYERTIVIKREINITPEYTARNDIPYKVIHKQEQLDGTYLTVETENKTGTTDSSVTPGVNSYTGYEQPLKQTVRINGDGTTVVEYKYKRIRYTFKINDRTYVDSTTTENGTYPYGKEITLKAIARAGYNFSWSDGNTNYERVFTLEQNIEVTPEYTARNDTQYQVIHKRMDLNGEYTIVETEDKEGTTDNNVTPEVKTYTGFKQPDLKTEKINGNGTTKIEYLYEREKYQVTILHPEYVVEGDISNKYYYETELTLTAKDRSGHTFKKWSTNETTKQITVTVLGEITLEPLYDVNIHTITFNAQGGTSTEDERAVAENNEIGSLPTATKENNIFIGWFTSTTGGTQITENEIVTGPITYYAHYKKSISGATISNTNIEIKIGEDETINISNVEEEYTFTSTDPSIATVDANGKVTGVAEGTTTIVITGSESGETKVVNVAVKVNAYKVTYNANGGNFYNVNVTTNDVSYTLNETSNQYETEDTYKKPTKTDKKFVGWYTNSSCTDGNEFDIETYTLTEDLVVYAKWEDGEATLLPGYVINGCTYYSSSDSCSSSTTDGKIKKTSKSFSRSTTIPEEYLNDTYVVSTEDSDIPIYMWYEEDTQATKWYSDVTNIYLNPNSSFLFLNKTDLVTLDLSGIDTSKVTSMVEMFRHVTNVSELNLSNFNTSNVTNMRGMFGDMWNLESLDLRSFDTINVTNMGGMFQSLSTDKMNLSYIDLSSFNTSKVTNMANMFDGCAYLEELDLSHFNTEKVTSFAYMFSNCSSLETLDISTWNTPSATNMKNMFSGCSNLTALNLSNFSTNNVTSMESMFYGCSSLTSLNLSSFNTGNVTSMASMFSQDSMLESINLSTFNTANVTTMSNMFNNCSSLTELNLNHFNTAKVTTMFRMFNNCSSLESLKVNFNTANVTNMAGMFYNCSSLTELDLSSFDTSKVISFSLNFAGVETGIFGECTNLRKIIASDKFVTTKVTADSNHRLMFDNCTSLVGGKGTVYDPDHIDKEYAHIDGGQTNPGYFTSNIVEYTVSFNTDGGSNVASQTIDIGGHATRPATDPTKSGYNFVDWYTTSSYTTLFDFDSEITEDTIIYARFVDDSYVAEKNGTLYTSLTAAIESVTINSPKATIKILKDFEETVVINENQNIKIDGGNHTISYSSSDTSIPLIENNGTLELVNGIYTSKAKAGVLNNNSNGTLIIDGATISATGKRQGVYNDGGNLTITGDANISASTTERATIHNKNNGTINILSGTITSVNLYAVYNEKGSINIGDKDGTVDLDTPVIEGKTYGVVANNVYNFYDGIIKGKTYAIGTTSNTGNTPTISADTNAIKINDKEDETDIVEGTSGDYKTIYLGQNTKYRVTLNANGGTLSQTSITKDMGVAVGTLPTPTAPTGKEFIGWYTGVTDGVAVTSSYTPNANVTIYARYSTLQYTVTLNANGGTLSETSITKNYGVAVGTLPTPTPPTGLNFDGWYTGLTDGVEVTSSYTPNINTTIYARYINPCKTFTTDSWSTIKNNLESDSSYYAVGCEKEVELDMNDDGTYESYTVRLANTSTPEVCNNDGYSQTACGNVIEFVDILENRKMNETKNNAGGWKSTNMATYLNSDFYNKLPNDLKSVIIPTYPIVSGSGNDNNSPNILSSDTNINKIYLLSSREVGANSSSDNKKNILTDTRTLDYYVGTASSGEESKRIKKKDDIASMWYLRTAVSVSNNSFYTTNGDGIVGLVESTNEYGVSPAFRIGTMPEFTVTFDTDGGSTVSTQTIAYGDKITKPSTDPTKEGYTFDNWYTDDTYQTLFDFDNTVITSDTTIYANWERAAVFDTGRNVNIKMKELAGHEGTIYTDTRNTSITSIKKSSIKPDISIMRERNIVSASNSNLPIYMWYDNGIMYWWSEDTEPSLNQDSSFMFKDLRGLTSLDVSLFDTSNVTSMNYMFDYCTSLTSLDLGDKFDTSNVTSMVGMFDTCYSLTNLDLGDKFDTSNVTNMGGMFYGCMGLTSLDLGDNFDTSNVTNMKDMFNSCIKLTSIKLGDNFDTSNVTDMSGMFINCQELILIDLGDKFDTRNVTNMNSMFADCYNLTTLDLGDNFDTSNVTNMNWMFSKCGNLTTLKLGDKFYTSNVTTMVYMFSECNALTTLDLGDKFYTSNVTTMQGMFSRCSNLTTIYVTDAFDTTFVTSSSGMFTSDTKLVGGAGTVYDSTKKDKTYAHIDGGPTNPGYLTERNATTYAVTFDTNGGSSVASQTITYGNKVTKPSTDPTKSGYTFDNWYTDDTYQTVFDFDNTVITSATTIYAHFEELIVCAENENITRLSETTCSNNENITVGDGIVCKRAVKLHEETCEQTNDSHFCLDAGYTASGSKGTNIITYGSCGTSGTLSSGDAFTCDVDGDGKFNELTERFYYVSDYYNTSIKEFDQDTAVLIYYNNVTSGVSCNKNTYVYDNISVNTNGPRAIKIQLPTTSQWSNISLINTSRQILTEAGTTSTTGGVLSVFSYEGYAARFVTTQELSSACNITELRNYTLEDLSGNFSKGELDGCNYIMENTKFANASLGSSAIYLETPSSSANNFVWVIHVYDRFLLNRNSVRYNNGARPVIEVPKTKISY